MNRRVVVTGIGMVTPVGLDTESSWEGLIAGRSGIGPITQFDDKDIPTQIAGEVKGFDAAKYIELKEIKKMDRFIHLAIAASQMAMDNARLPITPGERRSRRRHCRRGHRRPPGHRAVLPRIYGKRVPEDHALFHSHVDHQ